MCSATARAVADHGRLTLVWLSFGFHLAIMVMFCVRGQAATIGKGQAGQASAIQVTRCATGKAFTANLYLLLIQELLAQFLKGLEAI